jgi:tRNA(Ile)-lysidine synthase
VAELSPAVAATRVALRRELLGSAPGLALAACSGGADSLALAAALAFVAPRANWRAGLITVDHQLQPGSAERADAVADWARKADLDPVVVRTVTVAGRSGGPEAAARDARYEALTQVAAEYGASCVLLGHTEDDQAETVLLALLRGAGLHGLAGMPRRRIIDAVPFVRPFLGLSRSQTHGACQALGLTPWVDPHNTDPAYGRSRARTLLLSFVDSLGASVVGNLARTARLAAADAAVLDDLAVRGLAGAETADGALLVVALAELPAAVRTRVLHRWARGLGVAGSALSHRHVDALDALVIDWHGQGPVHLPGGIQVARVGGRLRHRAGLAHG